LNTFRCLYKILLIGTLLSLTCGVVWPEAGVLVVHVKDAQRHPVSGIRIGVEGDGGSSTTGGDGKARIPLAKQTKEKSWVSLQILDSPPGKDFVMVSPWDYKTIVPSFENESENFVEVVVVQRGDRVALESGSVLAALATRINSANAPKTIDKQSLQNPEANLAAVAKQYGLSSEELDQAIRAWAAKTNDVDKAGQAALYVRNYAKASEKFAESLREREQALAADQKAVADSACFLGDSRYREGKYRESAVAYQRCLQLRPDDSGVLNALALSLEEAGEYATAEPLYRRALELREASLKPDDHRIAESLSNLATLLRRTGDYKQAEQLARHALAIDEDAREPNDFRLAASLNNLALLGQDQGDYQEARKLFERSVTMCARSLGPDNPNTAKVLNNFAMLLNYEEDYQEAEKLGRQALTIEEKTLGPEHPEVPVTLNTLGLTLEGEGKYEEAEQFFQRALTTVIKEYGGDNSRAAAFFRNLGTLELDRGNYVEAEELFQHALYLEEKTLGPEHPEVANTLSSAAVSMRLKGDYEEAEKMYRRALAIYKKAFGPEHPYVARTLGNLGILFGYKGDYNEAERLERLALEMDEKALGPDSPAVATDLYYLGMLLRDKHDYDGAAASFQRALEIYLRTLGPNNLQTQRVRDELATLGRRGSFEDSRR
jgi:tetratricopeptide (TPR) repeat protein